MIMMFLAQVNGTKKMSPKTRHIIESTIMIAAIAIMMLCSGCSPFSRYVHIHDRYPIYDTPEKTTIPQISGKKLLMLDKETREQVITVVRDLKSEAAQLRALLDSYNTYAKRKNAEYDQLFRKK